MYEFYVKFPALINMNMDCRHKEKENTVINIESTIVF